MEKPYYLNNANPYAWKAGLHSVMEMMLLILLMDHNNDQLLHK